MSCGLVRSGFAAFLFGGMLTIVCPVAVADRINLAALTELEDAKQAGRIVKEYKGETLEFPQVGRLSPAAAEVLAKHDTDIELNAVRKLDADLAAAWSGFKHTLLLHGVTHLDDQTSAALAAGSATLSLENLESLTHVQLAAKLAKQANFLRFRRLTKIEKPVADALSQGICGLALPMIETLDHAGIATKLLNDGTYPCIFERLAVLEPAAGKALCVVPCDLYFKSLTKMPPAVAKALEGHRGVLDVDQLEGLDPAACASLLTNNGPLDLGGCDTLVVPGQPVPPAVLEAFSGHQGSLTLGGLANIPLDLADAIRQRQHHTTLTDVAFVTAVLAGGLAGKGGPNGVVWLPHATEIEQGQNNAAQALLMIKPRPGPVGALGPAAIILPGELKDKLPEALTVAIEKHACLHFNNQFGP